MYSLSNSVGMWCNFDETCLSKNSSDKGRCVCTKFSTQLTLLNTTVTLNPGEDSAEQIRTLTMSFAILIMNAFTPLINKAFKPKVFGVVKPSKN